MSIADGLEKMLAAGQDSAMLRFGLGSAYFNEKAYQKAIPHLKSCIEQDADYSAAYKLLGRSLIATGANEDARGYLEKGLMIAHAKGDKQTEKEISVFLKRLQSRSE